jgi:uncharacterized repeat protein (TIGR03803 family)
MAATLHHSPRVRRRTVLGAGVAGLLSGWPGRSMAVEILHPGRTRYKVIYRFDKPSDARIEYLYGGVIQASDGCLYGLAGTDRIVNGARAGLIFQIDRAHRLRIVEQFQYEEGTGRMSPLMQSSDGMLYGTTYFGGEYGHGTIYRLNAASELEVVHAFTDSGGSDGPLLEASDGNLYGTTEYGGVGKGSVYRLSRDGRLDTLYAFKAVRNNGRNPIGGLVQASDGHLYGVTRRGGEFGYGIIYRLTLDGEFTLLHSLALEDGAEPRTPLVLATDGRLYGSTPLGGHQDKGTLFSISLDGEFRLLHRLGEPGPVSGRIIYPLLAASDGHVYGTASGLSSDDSPTLFRLSWGAGLAPILSDISVVGGLCETSEGALVGTIRGDIGPEGSARIFRILDARNLP